MTDYSIAEARNKFTKVVRDAELSGPVSLTRHGKIVAVILSVEEYKRLQGGQVDFWSALQQFRADYELIEPAEVEKIFADVREESAGREFRFEE